MQIKKKLDHNQSSAQQRLDAALYMETEGKKKLKGIRLNMMPEYKNYICVVMYTIDDFENPMPKMKAPMGVAIYTKLLVCEGKMQAADFAMFDIQQRYANPAYHLNIVTTEITEIGPELLAEFVEQRKQLEIKYKAKIAFDKERLEAKANAS